MGGVLVLCPAEVANQLAASANADADNAVTVTAADTYTTAMTLDADLNATTAGRQVQVVVNLKVPEGTSGGSYSTNYTVQSATP